MYGEVEEKMKKMVGTSVKRIFFTTDHLQFETDKGSFAFGVEGDCCSHSLFYDFYGVKNLLSNGKITEVKQVDLDPKGKDYNDARNDYESEDIKIYGVQFTTESKEFGPVTSVFSFRNYSNGYYGGSLILATPKSNSVGEIFDDVIELKEN